MDVREKLVELIEKASYECDEGTRDLYDMREVADGIADFLIANGVTVQECKLGVKKTNADRIRSMNDEELAEFLTHINPTNCKDCAFSHGWRCQPDRDKYSDFEKCKEGRKKWLQQPAEEADNETVEERKDGND